MDLTRMSDIAGLRIIVNDIKGFLNDFLKTKFARETINNAERIYIFLYSKGIGKHA